MRWNDAGLRARLAEGGRQRIVEQFNWRKAAEETLAVYEEVVRRPRSFAVAGMNATTATEPGT